MEEKFPPAIKLEKTNDLAWNNFELSLETLLRNRRQAENSSTEPQFPPSPCSTLSGQLPLISSPAHLISGVDQVHHPIPTISTMTTQNGFPTIYPLSSPTVPSPNSIFSSNCEMCPSPSPFTGADQDNREIHRASHEHVKFLCAACGQRMVKFEEMLKHVETEHVGDDQELIRASIVIPDNIHMLKTFQCGIKKCGRKLTGLTEMDLKEHIRRNHGEFYIHMGQGRNIIRLCRLCPITKFVSDQALTEHVQQAHPVGMFANMERREILPALALSSAPLLRRERDVGVGKSDRICVDGRGPEDKRERLDVWYFRDQDQGLKRNGKLREDPSNALRLYNDQVDSETQGIGRRSRRDKFRSNEEEIGDGDDKEKNFYGEEDQFSMSPPELRKKRVEQLDLKYKLKKLREANKSKHSASKVYCQACNTSTHDWVQHKDSLKHNKKDKKARCLYCPKRVWFSKLKFHIQTEHKGNSFKCNVTNSCLVRLMDLGKLTEHINDRHREQVDNLCQQFGQNWQSSFVSSHHLAKSNFFQLPSDPRKLSCLSCRLCGLKFLGQDQAALTQHFQLEHPDLSSSRYKESTLYECRACDGVVFGSEVYLVEHCTHDHEGDGLSRDNEADLSKKWSYRMGGGYFEAASPVKEEYLRKMQGESLYLDEKPSDRHWKREISPDFVEHVRIRPTRARSVSRHHNHDEIVKNYKDAVCDDEDVNHNKRRQWPSSRDSNRKRRFSESFNSEELTGKSREIGDGRTKTVAWRKRFFDADFGRTSQRISEHNFYEDDIQAEKEDPIVVCPFCDEILEQSILKSHMKKQHKENLFSCDGLCSKKFKSAWKSEVITHLKSVHKQDLNDNMLSRCCLKLPSSLAMISCKISDCYETIFLARNVKQVEKQLVRHVEKYHGGQPVPECFHLACRGCYSVFPVSEADDWKSHLTEDHTLGANIKPWTVPSSQPLSGAGQETSEEREIRLVDDNDTEENFHIDANKDETVQCKFCGDKFEEEKLVEHELKLHLPKLFSCHTCQGSGRIWVGRSALDLINHAALDHNKDIKIDSISPPDDLDTNLSICTVCKAQFYTKDPSVLATHLLDHDMGPDMGLFRKGCRICYSVRGDRENIENICIHKDEVQLIQKKIIEFAKEPTRKKALSRKKKQNQTEVENLKKDIQDSSQACIYCDKIKDKDEMLFHISTQHLKSTFRCNICVNSKITIPTKLIAVFDKLEQAVEHMSTFHQQELLKTKIELAVSSSSPNSVCPVILSLNLHSPALLLPATTSLTQLHCTCCQTALLKLNKKQQLIQLCSSCDSSQEMLLQCKLCHVILPDNDGCGAAAHFK